MYCLSTFNLALTFTLIRIHHPSTEHPGDEPEDEDASYDAHMVLPVARKSDSARNYGATEWSPKVKSDGSRRSRSKRGDEQPRSRSSGNSRRRDYDRGEYEY